MGYLRRFLKPVVTSLLLAMPAQAQDMTLDDLYDQLADPATENWRGVERRIIDRWSRSGSVAMDLLLKRGRDAVDAGEWAVAIEHLTALTDHAPEVAEGWHLRATAFFNLDRTGEALEDIARTLTLDPRHYGAMTGLAVILAETGAKAEALEAYRMVKAANPHRPDLDEAIARLERETAGSDI